MATIRHALVLVRSAGNVYNFRADESYTTTPFRCPLREVRDRAQCIPYHDDAVTWRLFLHYFNAPVRDPIHPYKVWHVTSHRCAISYTTIEVRAWMNYSLYLADSYRCKYSRHAYLILRTFTFYEPMFNQWSRRLIYNYIYIYTNLSLPTGLF